MFGRKVINFKTLFRGSGEFEGLCSGCFEKLSIFCFSAQPRSLAFIYLAVVLPLCFKCLHIAEFVNYWFSLHFFFLLFVFYTLWNMCWWQDGKRWKAVFFRLYMCVFLSYRLFTVIMCLFLDTSVIFYSWNHNLWFLKKYVNRMKRNLLLYNSYNNFLVMFFLYFTF